jgi:hypothetical protein
LPWTYAFELTVGNPNKPRLSVGARVSGSEGWLRTWPSILWLIRRYAIVTAVCLWWWLQLLAWRGRIRIVAFNIHDCIGIVKGEEVVDSHIGPVEAGSRSLVEV